MHRCPRFAGQTVWYGQLQGRRFVLPWRTDPRDPLRQLSAIKTILGVAAPECHNPADCTNVFTVVKCSQNVRRFGGDSLPSVISEARAVPVATELAPKCYTHAQYRSSSRQLLCGAHAHDPVTVRLDADTRTLSVGVLPNPAPLPATGFGRELLVTFRAAIGDAERVAPVVMGRL